MEFFKKIVNAIKSFNNKASIEFPVIKDDVTPLSEVKKDKETILKEKRSKLLHAVRAKDVQTAYKLLEEGVSPNFIETWIVGSEVCDPFEMATSPLDEARNYEPMVRLLKHFGALDISGINALKRRQEEEKRERARQEYLKKMAPKVQADNDFLDKVIN